MLVPKLRFKREDGTDYPEWEEKKVRNCCDVFIDGDWIESKDQSEEGVWLIQTGNVGNGVFISKEDRMKFVSNETFERLKCHEVFSGDILISRLPDPAGRACIVPEAKRRMITAVDCTIVRTNSKVLFSIFLAQFYQAHSHFKYVKGFLAGGTRKRISRTNLEAEIIPIPCLEEQQKIADFLSNVDEVIAQSEAEVANLQQQKKAAMQKIFSQEVRFKREDGTDYPEWEEKKLAYCFEERNTKQIPTDEAPLMAFIAYKGVADKGDRYDRSYLVKTDGKKYKRTEYNDFIYSSNNLDVGSIGLNKYGTAVISVVYQVFKVKDTAIPDFISALLHTPENMNKIIQYRQGCLYGQYKIYANDFLSVITAIPCPEEQQKIADFLATYDEAISCAKQELDKWKELKKGLLQQMFA